MTGFRRTFKDLLSVGISFIFIYNAIWTLALGFYGRVGYDFMVLLMPFLLMYVIRRLARKGYVFLIATALLCLISWFFLRYLQAEGVIIFFLFLSLVHSLASWSRNEVEPTSMLIVVFFAFHLLLFYFVSPAYYGEAHQAKIIATCLIFTGFTIIYRQMDSLDFKLYLQRDNDELSLSTRRLVRTNNNMGFVFAGLVLVAGFLSIYLPVHLIGRFFSWLAALLVGLIPSPPPAEVDFGPLFVPPAGEADWVLEIAEEVAPTEPGILDAILNFIAMSLIVIAVLLLLYAIAKKIKPRKKSEKLSDAQEEVKLAGSLLDDLLDLLPRFKKMRHPIRRAYEKKVNLHIKQGILVEDYDTTDIIAEKIRETEDIDELTAKYEIVRYGRDT